ncbi:MAG: NYN domain-containing protein [Oscillospiraceae bacterium]|nr:NYN domain-containing protein [Oscillospiraceae bacterium]
MKDRTDKKRICLSITAHVDAGKTTLAEALLYEAGELKKRGCVDHRDSSLDYEDFERARGITAFSKQAVFSYGNTDFSLIDTPGHTDLFAETKRGLKVPDAAVLVVSGSEGVQADTGTIWELLERQKIPTWIFVSKMDLVASDKEKILRELKEKLSDGVTDFTLSEERIGEAAAELDEACLEEYLGTGSVTDHTLKRAISARSVFPCFFGSGLKLDGIRPFLEGLDRWTEAPVRTETFSALCYKISRDARGQRMTQVKITGGSLSVRETVRYRGANGNLKEEKVTGIRIYSGARYDMTDRVEAGQVCCLLGLTETAAGCLLGEETTLREESTEAVRRFSLRTEGKQDPVVLLTQLRQLSEELPELQPDADRKGISVCLSGKIQAEMLRALLLERFGVKAWLEEGRLIYKETVTKRVEGIRHFEPLRHYAEVHLILEPGEAGSGVVLESVCPEDALDRNWQNLILDALRGVTLPGVLTGAELTDVRIRLASGRAHPKHTEGGDFREATRRALRHGLMQAECVLLEPLYRFAITLPAEQLGRAISDLRSMHAELETPEQEGETARLTGTVPAGELADYPETLLSYTHGLGKITVHPAGYRPCHNAQEVLAATDYQAERDTEWPADSVFCSHGAGTVVPWREVKDYMHLPSVLEEQTRRQQSEIAVHRVQRIEDRELEAIMLREFGPVKRPQITQRREAADASAGKEKQQGKHTLVVDGYNFIFAESELKRLARESLSAAREYLMDRLSNYCAFTGQEMVLVFDGFRTAGNPGSRDLHTNIHVVYTPEGESADAYIERLASQIGKNDRVSVVTADTMIRISAMRSGVLRISPEEFGRELAEAEKQLSAVLARSNDQAHQTRGEDAIVYRKEERTE